MAEVGKRYTFDNGPNCKGHGVVFGDADGSLTSFDVVELTGQYPEREHWSRNRFTKLAVRALRGNVSVVFRGEPTVVKVLDEERFEIPAKTWYAYVVHGSLNGDATTASAEVELIGDPAFDSDQYEVVHEAVIAEREAASAGYSLKGER